MTRRISDRRAPDAPSTLRHRTAATEAKPVLKWAGGKSKLLPHILAQLPGSIETYFEPFAGGAAVFFSLAQSGRFKRAVLADRNRDLIGVYQALKRDAPRLIRILQGYSYDRDEYYRARDADPNTLDPFERAARIIFLNKTGYNGLYRVNRSGRFNVPFGRYTNPTICDEPRLLRAASLLAKTRLEVSDFESVCREAKPGDAIYFDPPYVPLSRTANFTAYHSETFDDRDHERLARVFAELGARNVRSVLSNSSTPLTRELYRDFSCQKVMVKRPINSRTSGRGHVAELLVVNSKPGPARSRTAANKSPPARESL